MQAIKQKNLTHPKISKGTPIAFLHEGNSHRVFFVDLCAYRGVQLQEVG